MVSIYELTALVVSVIAGIFAWATAKDNNVKAYVSVLVILGGACLTMIASVRFEQLPLLEQNLSLAPRDPQAELLLREYMGANEILRASSDPFMPQYFAIQRNRFLAALTLARNGQYRVEKEDIGVFANKVIEIAENSVVATSYVSSAEWWETSWGRQYEALNYEKVDQGVTITRYFLFSSDQERTKAQPMLQRQVQNGVNVYAVNLRDTADIYWNDVIVVDDAVGGELLLTPEKTIRHVLMYTRGEDIDRLKNDILGLRVRSTLLIFA